MHETQSTSGTIDAMAKKPDGRPVRISTPIHPTPAGRNVQHFRSVSRIEPHWGFPIDAVTVRLPRTPGGKHDNSDGTNTG
jgi:hypothetical protein